MLDLEKEISNVSKDQKIQFFWFILYSEILIINHKRNLFYYENKQELRFRKKFGDPYNQADILISGANNVLEIPNFAILHWCAQ